MFPKKIKITSDPLNFLPEEVKRDLIDLVLPLKKQENAFFKELKWNKETGEILSHTMIEVNTDDVLNALKEANKSSSVWFTENKVIDDFPEMVFGPSCCKFIIEKEAS